MLATGRGSIAQVQYTGDEAAAEIHKLLHAVVSCHPNHPKSNRVVLIYPV
jgi:pre-mRNA-processing factor 39